MHNSLPLFQRVMSEPKNKVGNQLTGVFKFFRVLEKCINVELADFFKNCF